MGRLQTLEDIVRGESQRIRFDEPEPLTPVQPQGQARNPFAVQPQPPELQGQARNPFAFQDTPPVAPPQPSVRADTLQRLMAGTKPEIAKTLSGITSTPIEPKPITYDDIDAITQAAPQISQAEWDKFKASLPQQREYSGFFDELGRSIAAGTLNVGSGLLSSLAEASGTAIWDRDQIERGAAALRKLGGAKALEQGKGGGARGFIAQAVGQAIPYMGAAVISTIATGQPYSAFVVGFSVEGQGAKQNALARGATEEQAQTEQFIVGVINGAIEQLQIGRVFKFAKTGKASIKAISTAARQKAFRVLAREGGKLTVAAARISIEEGLEEALQESATLLAPALSGDIGAIPPISEFAAQIGKAALGGAVAGPILGGAGGAIGAISQRTDTGKPPIPPITDIFKGRKVAEAPTAKHGALTADQRALLAAKKPKGAEAPAGEAVPSLARVTPAEPTVEPPGEIVQPAGVQATVRRVPKNVLEKLARDIESGEKAPDSPEVDALFAEVQAGIKEWKETGNSSRYDAAQKAVDEFDKTLDLGGLVQDIGPKQLALPITRTERLQLVQQGHTVAEIGAMGVEEARGKLGAVKEPTEAKQPEGEIAAKKQPPIKGKVEGLTRQEAQQAALIEIKAESAKIRDDFDARIATETKPTVKLKLAKQRDTKTEKVADKISAKFEAALTQPPTPKAEAKVKQPWEMTKGEFFAQPHHPRDARFAGDQFHHDFTKDAVSRGLPVPRNVLEEYKGEAWADKALAAQPPTGKAEAKVEGTAAKDTGVKAEGETKATFTSIPQEWTKEEVLFDRGKRGLRTRNNRKIEGITKFPGTTAEFEQLPVRLPAATMKALKARTNEVFKIRTRNKSDHWLVPKQVVAEVRARLGKKAFVPRPKPARSAKQKLNDNINSMKRHQLEDFEIGGNIIDILSHLGLTEADLSDKQKGFVKEFRDEQKVETTRKGIRERVEQKVSTREELDERTAIQDEDSLDEDIGDFLDSLEEEPGKITRDLLGQPVRETKGGAAGKQLEAFDKERFKLAEPDLPGQQTFPAEGKLKAKKVTLPFANRKDFEQFFNFQTDVETAAMPKLVQEWKRRLGVSAGKESSRSTGRSLTTTMTTEMRSSLQKWAEGLLVEHDTGRENSATRSAKSILKWLNTIAAPTTKAEAETRIIPQSAYESAKKRLNNKNTLMSGIDPQAIADMITVGAYHFETGLRTFAKWSKQMAKDFGAKIDPYINRIWEQVSQTPDAKDVETRTPKDVQEFMKRKNNLAPLTVTKETQDPGNLMDGWFAERDEKIQEADVAVRNFQNDIKKATGSKRFGKGQRRADQLIQLHIDLKNNPSQADKFFDDITPQQQALVKDAQNLSPELRKVAQSILIANNKIGISAFDVGVINNVIENYSARLWEPSKQKQTFFHRRFGTKTARAKQRTLEGILHGWSKGKKLAITGATNAHGVMRSQVEATIADRRLLKTGKIWGLLDDQKHEDWLEVEHPNFVDWKWVGQVEISKDKTITEGTMVRPADRKNLGKVMNVNEEAGTADVLFINKLEGTEATKTFDLTDLTPIKGYGQNFFVTDEGNLIERRRIYAPKPLAKHLNNALGKSKLIDVPGIQFITEWNSRLKRLILFTSFFHHQAYIRSFSLGAKAGFQSLTPGQAYKAGKQAIENFTPDLRKLVRNGLTIGKIQDYDESILQGKGTVWGKLFRRFKVIDIPVTKLEQLRDWNERILFKQLGPYLKVQAALLEYASLRKKNKKQLAAGTVTLDALAKIAANLANDDFGGLHLGRLGRNPTLQHIFRLLALAPDWTESNVRSAVKAFKSGEEGKVYRAFWGRIALKGLLATVATNYLLSLFDDDEGEDGAFIKRYKDAWESGHMRWMDVDITPFYKALGGKDDKRKYFSVLGHFKDPIKFVAREVVIDGPLKGAPDPIKSLILSAKYKGSVITRIFSDGMTGTDWANREFTTTAELLGIDDKGRYQVSRRGQFRKGQPKGGKLKGELAKWTWGAGSKPIGLDQVPSFLLYETKSAMPIQVQNAINYYVGEMDGFDAALKSLGIHVSTAHPKKE